MATFREGIENLTSYHTKTIVDKDLVELGEKIQAFKDGTIHEDKFKALRLARGVYGQRQQGVQMIRIKLPFGKVTTKQLLKICDVSDEYSTGRLHITTRQDIQIHYVSLDRTPQLWAELEQEDVTLREACGNTVRNVTASSIAGIDPQEPFDVSPYADLVFRYFLRKPFGQELGRKIKIAFSSNDTDDAYAFIHDFGFIPKILNGQKGFKVLVGGGLGAQPILAQIAYEFLPENEIIPFIEASIRVFDRYGERNNRNKARLKYLIAKIGFEAFKNLVEIEKSAVQFNVAEDFKLSDEVSKVFADAPAIQLEKLLLYYDDALFANWVRSNVFIQKQKGYFGVFIKVVIGDFTTDRARILAEIVQRYAADDIRFTIDQNILLKFVLPHNLYNLFTTLKTVGFADTGYNSLADVTACPGTDTCNLGIANSTEVARVIESVIRLEFPELVYNKDIKIKISGCMNSCGQHGLAHIGLHGSSMKVLDKTAPALQLLLGGGNLGDGVGRIADKVIKFPSKRVVEVIRTLLHDFLNTQEDGEQFNEYYERQGNKYFYGLIKPLAAVDNLTATDFIDWGSEDKFKTQIGVGECAGIVIDLVATLIYDAEEKVLDAENALAENRFADAAYFTYAAAIHTAKALLLNEKVQCNTQIGVMQDFDLHLGMRFGFDAENSFNRMVMQIHETNKTQLFATNYLTTVKQFIQKAKTLK